MGSGVVELRSKSLDELHVLVRGLRLEVVQVRFAMSSSQGGFSNMARLRFLRRSIARVCTIISQKKHMNTVDCK